MAGTWLPLFPLNVVLFPRSALPLHIFEERYKVLINECLERGTSFGITLTTGEGLAAVGCSASVSSLTRRYDDGRMDVVVGGGQRYRLLGSESGRAPYLMGRVDYFDEPGEAIDRDLAASTAELFNDILKVVYGEKGALIGRDRLEIGLSFLIAQKAGLDLEGRQRILEMPGENQRLRVLHSYLEDLLPKVKRRGEIGRIVGNDGYL